MTDPLFPLLQPSQTTLNGRNPSAAAGVNVQWPHTLRFQIGKRVGNEGAVSQSLEAARAADPYVSLPIFEERSHRSSDFVQRSVKRSHSRCIETVRGSYQPRCSSLGREEWKVRRDLRRDDGIPVEVSFCPVPAQHTIRVPTHNSEFCNGRKQLIFVSTPPIRNARNAASLEIEEPSTLCGKPDLSIVSLHHGDH